MSTFRRIFVSIGAPLVVIGGIGVLWGVRNASAVKAQIEAWADSLEHSPNAVAMEGLRFIPVFVEGQRVGKLDAVVIQRHQPGTVDSVRIMVAGNADLGSLADCQIQLDPDEFDDKGPLGITHALKCVQDTSELVRFGSVQFEEANREFALFLSSNDLPCSHMGDGASVECTRLHEEVQKLREEIRQEVRVRIRNP